MNRTHDNNMSGVKTITKQALHHLAGQRLVSIQEHGGQDGTILSAIIIRITPE
jgi:hypothetical protein